MVYIIVAISKNNAIGKDNELLFRIKEDLQFFKTITLNKVIVMGRKTFESLPGVLPSRKHIVITRDLNYSVHHENVEVRHSLEEVLKEYSTPTREVMVIGGGQIYKEALNLGLVDKMYITKVDETVEDADTFFPDIDLDVFEVCNVKILNKKASVYTYLKKKEV